VAMKKAPKIDYRTAPEEAEKLASLDRTAT
jgi:hypothetical protein